MTGEDKARAQELFAEVRKLVKKAHDAQSELDDILEANGVGLDGQLFEAAWNGSRGTFNQLLAHDMKKQ